MHSSFPGVVLVVNLSFVICHHPIDCTAISELGLVYAKPVFSCVHCGLCDPESLLDWRSRSHIRMLKVAKLANLSLDSVCCEQHWYFVSAPEVNLAWHNWSIGCLTHLLVSNCLAVVYAFAAVVRRTVELIFDYKVPLPQSLYHCN